MITNLIPILKFAGEKSSFLKTFVLGRTEKNDCISRINKKLWNLFYQTLVKILWTKTMPYQLINSISLQLLHFSSHFTTKVSRSLFRHKVKVNFSHSHNLIKDFLLRTCILNYFCKFKHHLSHFLPFSQAFFSQLNFNPKLAIASI
jgi:hypothetical protein